MKKNERDKSSFPSQINCPVCSESFKPEKTEEIDHKKDFSLQHSYCTHCENAIILLVHSSQGYDATVSIATDLTPEDVKRTQKMNEITSDEVIEFYEFLQKEKNPLSHVSKNKPKPKKKSKDS